MKIIISGPKNIANALKEKLEKDFNKLDITIPEDKPVVCACPSCPQYLQNYSNYIELPRLLTESRNHQDEREKLIAEGKAVRMYRQLLKEDTKVLEEYKKCYAWTLADLDWLHQIFAK